MQDGVKGSFSKAGTLATWKSVVGDPVSPEDYNHRGCPVPGGEGAKVTADVRDVFVGEDAGEGCYDEGRASVEDTRADGEVIESQEPDSEEVQPTRKTYHT